MFEEALDGRLERLKDWRTVSDQDTTGYTDYFARLGEHDREHLADPKPLP